MKNSNNKKGYIRLHESFTQAEEEQAKYIALQKPEDRIKETVQLILRVFGLPKKTTGKQRIIIDIQ